MLELKRILVAVPVAVLIFFLLTGAASAEGNKAGIINAGSVNLRATPDTSAKIIMQLSKDANITVTEVKGDWCKISYNDSTGWVFGQYVTLKDTVIDSGVVNVSDVNVRSKPDINSEILKKLDKGTKLEIFEYSANWARVKIEEGRFGWVSKDYVTVLNEKVSRGETSGVKESAEEEGLRVKLVAYAKKFLGVKYVYGGSSPKGFDCSGFTSYIFKNFGITLERTSSSQGQNGTEIKRSELKPGDLVFFDTNGGHNAIEHVGMYIGGGRFIHASSGSSGKKVINSDMQEGFYNDTYMTARRYVND